MFPKSVNEILDRIRGDIASRVSEFAQTSQRAIIDVISTTFAGVIFGIYGYAEYIFKQIFPLTAENDYLNLHAEMWGVSRGAKTKARGVVIAEVESGITNLVIPEGIQLVSGDGARYVTMHEAGQFESKLAILVEAVDPGENSNISSGSLTFTTTVAGVKDQKAELFQGGITQTGSTATGAAIFSGSPGSVINSAWMQDPVGSTYLSMPCVIGSGGYAAGFVRGGGARPAGTLLAFLGTPPTGVDPTAVVAGEGVTGGANELSDEMLRHRIRQRIQHVPHGGALEDYKLWAYQTEGVSIKNVWVFGYPTLSEGNVHVYFTTSDLDPIPSAAQKAMVAAKIEEFRPVTAKVSVFGPSSYPLDITAQFTVATGYDFDEVYLIAELEIRQVLSEFELSRDNTYMPISLIYSALAKVNGLKSYSVTSINSDSPANVLIPAYFMPTLGDFYVSQT